MAALSRHSLFATPVFVFQLDGTDALDRELTERLLAEREVSPGVTRSNVGGWHSRPDLAQRDDACFRQVCQLVADHVSVTLKLLADEAQQPTPELRYAVHAWAMIMRDGDYTALHDHGDAHWSVVYYADAGDIHVPGYPDSGVLVLVDPRRGGRMPPGIELFPGRFRVTPRTGTLVVFPAWLQHFVHSYRGQRPRVAISANLIMRG